MINIENELAFFRSTFFHEVGHVLGYCLADKNAATSLGRVKKFQIGFRDNFVVPFDSYYHIEKNILDDMKRITDATKSIKRTLAWFIEVLAGCTFQTLSEKGTFKNCFGSNRYSHNGFIDFSNLNVIRNISSFNWNFENLYQLQIEFSEIVSSHHQLLKIEPIINELSDAVKNAPNNQLIYMDSELEKLVQSIDQTISPSFSAAYLQLIEKYYDYFVNRN